VGDCSRRHWRKETRGHGRPGTEHGKMCPRTGGTAWGGAELGQRGGKNLQVPNQKTNESVGSKNKRKNSTGKKGEFGSRRVYYKRGKRRRSQQTSSGNIPVRKPGDKKTFSGQKGKLKNGTITIRRKWKRVSESALTTKKLRGFEESAIQRENLKVKKGEIEGGAFRTALDHKSDTVP